MHICWNSAKKAYLQCNVPLLWQTICMINLWESQPNTILNQLSGQPEHNMDKHQNPPKFKALKQMNVDPSGHWTDT